MNGIDWSGLPDRDDNGSSRGSGIDWSGLPDKPPPPPAAPPPLKPPSLTPATDAAIDDWQTGAAILPAPGDLGARYGAPSGAELTNLAVRRTPALANRAAAEAGKMYGELQTQFGKAVETGWSYHPAFFAGRKFLPREHPWAQISRAVPKGLGETAKGLAAPENVALIAATSGLGSAPAVLRAAISAGFSAHMLSGIPELWEAYQNAPDIETKAEILTQGAATLGFGIGAGAHAIQTGARVPSFRVRPTPQPPEVPASLRAIRDPRFMLADQPLGEIPVAELPTPLRVQGPTPEGALPPPPIAVEGARPAAPGMLTVAERFRELAAEGERLGAERQRMIDAGQPSAARALDEPIARINAELARGPEAMPERRFVAEIPQEFPAPPERRFVAQIEPPVPAEVARQRARGLRTIERPVGGGEYAIEPGDAKIQGRAIAQRIKEGARGDRPRPGDPDYAGGAPEGAPPGRELPRPGPEALGPDEFQRAARAGPLADAVRAAGGWREAAYDVTRAAHKEGRPLNAELWDRVNTDPPVGYERRGPVYEPQETKPWAEKLKGKIEAKPPKGEAINLWPEVIEFGKRIYRAGMDFAKWSAEMISHLGDKVRGQLRDIWDNIQTYIAEGGYGRTIGRQREAGAVGIPDWLREEMGRRGLKTGRIFNDVDLQNPSIRAAIQNDPTLTAAQKESLLKTGSLPEAQRKPDILKELERRKRAAGAGWAAQHAARQAGGGPLFTETQRTARRAAVQTLRDTGRPVTEENVQAEIRKAEAARAEVTPEQRETVADPTKELDLSKPENFDAVDQVVPLRHPGAKERGGIPIGRFGKRKFTSVDSNGQRRVGEVDPKLKFSPRLTTPEEFYRPGSLLGTGIDPKTVKGEKYGVRTYIMYLAAHKQAGLGINVCKFATKDCAGACLGKGGMGTFDSVREARINKTKYWRYDPATFMAQMDREITRGKAKAKADGVQMAVRLNGTSDILWEKSGIMEKHPDVQFYDYTKYPAPLRKNLPDHYHLTYSYTGLPGSEAFSRAWNERGVNTAVVFGGGMPAKFMGRPVIDGDVSDLRFRDPKGVIVGLHAKGPALKLIGLSPFIHQTPPGDVAIPYINPQTKARLLRTKGEAAIDAIKDAAPKAGDLKYRRGNPELGETAGTLSERAKRLQAEAGERGYTTLIPDVLEFGRGIYRKGMEYAQWAGEMVKYLGEKVREHLQGIWDDLQKLHAVPPGFRRGIEMGVPPPERPGFRREPAAAAERPGFRREEPVPEPKHYTPLSDPAVTAREQRSTSTKNEIVDAERQARGLSPIQGEFSQTHPQLWAEVQAKFERDPDYGKSVVDALIKDPSRGITPFDEAALLHEKIRVQNLREEAGEKADRATEEWERKTARDEYDRHEAYINDIDRATYRSGEIWGQFGSFRQRLALDDYSFEAMQKRMRVAKKGPLSKEEVDGLREDTGKIADLTRRKNKRVATLEEQQAKKNAQRRERLERKVAQAKGLEPMRIRGEPVPPDVEVEMLLDELARLRALKKERGRLPAAKQQTRKRIVEINRRMKEYGFAKPLRPEKLVADKELLELQFELFQVMGKLERGINAEKFKSMNRANQAYHVGKEIIALPRQLMASMDYSAVLRQGGLFMLTHPFKAIRATGTMFRGSMPSLRDLRQSKNFKDIFKAIGSERPYFEELQKQKDRKNSWKYFRDGLDTTEIHPRTRAGAEEPLGGAIGEKIWGVSHTQRAYTLYLNRIRMDWYDWFEKWLAGGEASPSEGKVIANAVNVFTGRGSISGPRLVQALAALNDVFFAPRWRISRFQTLLGQPLWTPKGGYAGTGRARALVAMEYGKILIGYGGILGLLATVGGQTIEGDTISSDFGKIKIGNTRFDFLAGLQQPFVLMNRIARRKTKTLGGEIKSIYGPEVGFRGRTAWDVLVDYARSGAAPLPGKAIDYWLAGTDIRGRPATAFSTFVYPGFVPLSVDDIVEAMKDLGAPRGAAAGLGSMFGVGVSTIEPKPAPRRTGQRFGGQRRSRFQRSRQTSF